jgi:hypothetical protein
MEKRGIPSAESEKYQAWMFIRQVMIDWMWGIKLTSWYSWSSLSSLDLKYTIVRSDGSLRPAFYAYRNLTNLLNGYNYTQKLPSVNPNDYLLVFKNKSDKNIIVVWTTTTEGEPYPNLPNTHTIKIPLSETGNVTVYDYLGNQSTVNVINGEILMQIDGGPRYIKVQ